MKVAIVKSRIYKGGVTQVLASIIQILNEKNIVPDLITLRCDITEDIVRKNYGQNIRFNIVKIMADLKMPYEWHFLYFNLVSRPFLKRYDLIIDSNNTSYLGQSKIKSINYTHYPRKDRVVSDLDSLHLPEGSKKNILDIKNDPFFIAKFLYRFDNRIKKNERIICNSHFTAAKVKENYPELTYLPEVIYPPVEINIPSTHSSKINGTIVTLGRFSEEKRQLEQIEMAKHLPELKFRILGFSGNGIYLNKCFAKVKEERITNVELIPNPDFESVQKIMMESQFFLHNVRNEPFGISTVQAIASGCVPVVHNSAGSKEIVKNEKLLFSDKEDGIRVLKNLLSVQESELINWVHQIDLKLYSRDYFILEFKKVLSEYIK